MNIVIRIIVTLVSAVATLYFVFWFAIPTTFLLHSPAWIGSLGSFLVAVVVAWYVWTHTASTQASLANSALLGAFVVGGIGFSAGFFGPLLFMPSGRANAGPLLGILTGPLGCILGAVVGAVHWYAREGRVSRTSNWPKNGAS
ncbi:MAG TPA: hypothetical protein VFE33_17850 [Thermoanaerobaculia bacterium]|nr:hypothetical protein [Thermoanaerobaculia bacterium]